MSINNIVILINKNKIKMNLLQNKRKRDEILFESNEDLKTPNIINNTFQSKNYLNLINNKEKILFEENKNNNNLYNIFQPISIIKNFKKEDNNLLSPFFNPNFNNSNIDKIFQNKRIKLFFSPSSFHIEKFINLEAFISNNYTKLPNFLELNKFEINEKNKNKIEQDLKKSGDENKNNKKTTFFDILINNNKKQTHFSIKKEFKLINNMPNNNINKLNNLSNPILNIPNINANLFTTKNTTTINNKKLNENQNNIIETSKPFQTYNTKLFIKNNQNSSKQKSGQPKIFHIEKIFNKKEYKDANEKESDEEDKNLKNRFKISLKKIKQIYTNSCLKIYSYINYKINYNENNLNDEFYISNIIQQVYEIIKEKKINSSKMNEILQVNDDDKYRKHYFMFTSEAKQFCLDLINIKKLSFDIVMKMCKVPRKSLRRWSHVGCNRKKGCGRKTRNPEMENKLVEWYNELKNQNIIVTAKMIREKAVEISGDKDFLASKGWLEKFKKKFNIRIVPHKNKNFKKIITLKEKNNKFNKENKDIKDIKEIKDFNKDIIKDNIKENINDNNSEEEEKDKSDNENQNENIIKNNEIKKNIIDNNLIKNLEIKSKNNKENILKKPIFLKTKIFDRGNSKKFNVFKYSEHY